MPEDRFKEDEMESSSVERLKKKLYVRNVVPKLKTRRTLHKKKRTVSNAWMNEEEIERRERQPQPKEQKQKGAAPVHNEDVVSDMEKVSGSTLVSDVSNKSGAVEMRARQRLAKRAIQGVFGASVLFFVLALVFAGYFLVNPQNQISCDNVDIVLSGPRTIASGKKLSLGVSVTNNNSVAMRNTTLEMKYPEGTRSAQNSSMTLPFTREQVGTIDPGERVRTTVNAILFGQEQTDQTINAVISYEVKDSVASFTCERPYSILIATAPVSLTVSGLEEISSGQEIELEIVMTSNSEEIVPDLRLVVDYPFGFQFISSDPEPTTGNNVWDVGDVAPTMDRILKVRGVVSGQGTEARTIGFSVGEKNHLNKNEIATVLQKIEHPLLITKPFLALDLFLNKDNSPQVTHKIGETISGIVKWKNTLQHALHDVEIDAHLDGILLEPHSVVANSGFFRSIDNTITWTPQTQRGFRMIEPGQEGTLYFSFRTKPLDAGTVMTNPAMSIDFAARARRISDNIPVHQNIQNQSKRTVLFDSEVMFDAYAVYGVGPFTNTGPHPPRMNLQTTYTVVMEMENTLNDIKNVSVEAELPVNIQWLSMTSPASESLTFNPVTRKVTWSIGDITKDVGTDTSSRKAYFQVSTIPSVSQLDDLVILANNLRLTAVDEFTDNMLEQGVRHVRTKLSKDPYFNNVRGEVEQ